MTEAAVRADYGSMDLAEFRRAYLNQWPDAAPEGWAVIAADDWTALVDRFSEPVAPVVLAAAFAGDRSSAAISLAGRRADGLVHVEVADHRPGTAWAAPRLADLAARHRPAAVVVDRGMPEASMIPELEAAGVEVSSPMLREIGAAFGQFYELVADSGGLRHRGQDALDDAVRFAVTRDVGDGGRTWARKKSPADIAPLVAVTLAVGALGPALAYDSSSSVHFDADEIARLVAMGVYGAADVERLQAAGIIPAGT